MKRGIRPAVFAAFVLVLFVLSYRALSWKDTMGDYLSSAEALYATKDDLIDVLFVGSSHCYAGINPDVLWRDGGIAAFDMAVSGQDKAAAFHYTKEALKTQSPAVVAVDLLAALYDEGTQSNTWRNMLSMRTSRNQIEMVLAETTDTARRADYILKWPVVHTRYRELSARDFITSPYNRFGRGYCYRFTAEPVAHDPALDAVTEAVPVSEENRRWFASFFALAEEEGFELVFLQIPHEMLADEKRIYNGVLAFLDGQGATYLDADTLSEGAQLNADADYLDAGHLNAYGAEKLTAYLGEWLLARYDLADHRGDGAYAVWDESLDYADRLYLEEALAATDGPVAYFSRLAGTTDLTVVLTLSGDYASSSFDLPGAVRQIGVTENFFARPGCAVVDCGALAGYLPADAPGEIRLDIDRLHTLWAAVPAKEKAAGEDAAGETAESGDEGSVSALTVVFDGEEQPADFDGLRVLVYDRKLEKIIGERIF